MKPVGGSKGESIVALNILHQSEPVFRRKVLRGEIYSK